MLTSPPYGDSRTTVQYGAASALCLELVSLIDGLDGLFARGADVDARCLGGHRAGSEFEASPTLRPYWGGAKESQQFAVVASFLADFAKACGEISHMVAPGGTVVMVLGERRVRGFRLKLEAFTTDQFGTLGFELTSRDERALEGKQLPRRINRFGRTSSLEMRAKGVTRTMTREVILVFRNRRP